MLPELPQLVRAVGKVPDRFPMELVRVAYPVNLVLPPTTGSTSVSNPIYFKLRLIIDDLARWRRLVSTRSVVAFDR
jgi:hypothetical protein